MFNAHREQEKDEAQHPNLTEIPEQTLHRIKILYPLDETPSPWDTDSLCTYNTVHENVQTFAEKQRFVSFTGEHKECKKNKNMITK